MFYFLATLFFLFGAIIGSFLNVVSLRYNTGISPFKGRSFCFSCGKKLGFFELIPIVSFIFQKGKCGGCESKISFQYILVEIITGFLFFIIFYNLHPFFFSEPLLFLSLFIFQAVIWSILIVILIYDLKHKIIPDGLVFTFIIISFLAVLISGFLNGFSDFVFISHILAGILIPLPFFLLWFISQGRWIGFGDVKLAIGIGFLLGIIDGIYSILLAFWIGAIIGLLIILFSHINKLGIFRLSLGLKNITIKSEIPFAPFLILGIFIALFWEIDFLDLEYLFEIILNDYK